VHIATGYAAIGVLGYELIAALLTRGAVEVALGFYRVAVLVP